MTETRSVEDAYVHLDHIESEAHERVADRGRAALSDSGIEPLSDSVLAYVNGWVAQSSTLAFILWGDFPTVAISKTDPDLSQVHHVVSVARGGLDALVKTTPDPASAAAYSLGWNTCFWNGRERRRRHPHDP